MSADAQGDFVEVEEGKKWTHTRKRNGEKCRVNHSVDGRCWIVDRDGFEGIVNCDTLKPIKPTITKKEHEVLCKFSADSGDLNVVAAVEAYLAKHDIVENSK